jgi:hypothetical protein
MAIRMSYLILFYRYFGTEAVILVVILLTCIQEVHHLNLGQDSGIQTDVFHGFLWSIQADAKIMIKP